MIIRAARDDTEALRLQFRRQCFCVLDDLRGILLKLRLERFAQRHCLRRDHMHQRSALDTGEDGFIELLAELETLAQDHASARTSERLVRRGRHHIGERQRARVLTARDQSRDVRHVDHQISAHAFSDRRQTLKVEHSGISRRARHDHLRSTLMSFFLERIVINRFGLAAHSVRDDLEILAAHVDGTAMRQMPAVGQIHAHDRIAGVEQSEEDCHIRLSAAVRLNVGILAIEKFFRAVDSQLLNHIDELTAAVISLAGITFGVFVGEHTALSLEHGAADDVLRSNQFEFGALTVELILDRLKHCRINFLQFVH